MRTLASLDSPISSLVVSPDGSKVITSSSEGIGFLDLVSGQRSVTPLDEEVSRLAWGPDGLLAGTSSGEVWSLCDAPVRLFEAIDDEISGIAAAGDGTIAVCGGEPFAVATFGPHGNEEWRGEPYKWPYCVRFSPDGKLLAVATWDGYLFVFDAHDLPDELDNGDGEPAGGPIFDARFLPGDRVLVAGASFVRVWDRGAGRFIGNHELDAEAFAVAVSPDASCAVASTNDQRLRLFSLPELTELGQLSSGNMGSKALSSFPDYAEFCHVKGPATFRTLAFHPDGLRVFGATEDRRIVEVARAELQQVAAPTAPQAPPARAETTPTPTPVEPLRAPAPAARRPAATKRAATKPAATKPAASKVAAKALATNKLATKLAATKLAPSKLAATKPAASNVAAKTLATTKLAATKLAPSKLATTKLAATKLAPSKLAATKPAASKVAAKTLATSKLATKLAATRLASSKVATTKLAATKVVPSKLAARKFTAGKLAAKELTTNKLAANLAATKLAPSKLAATKPAAGKVAGKKLAANKLAAGKIAARKPVGGEPASKKLAGPGTARLRLWR